MIEIADSALLSDLFGHWPDFHDAQRGCSSGRA
jgi:hypothetical protein